MLLFVGSVIPRKGVDLLLDAWARRAGSWPRTHLVIAGPREDRDRPDLEFFGQRLQTLRAASGAPDRVHFVGLVDQIQDYMRAADVFIFPSRREGMGNVVLEAMASALPVVLTPFVGFPTELGRPDKHFILADRNPASLGAVVDRLLENAELRQLLGRQAREWVQDRLDMEDSLDRYASLYRELADQRAGLGC